MPPPPPQRHGLLCVHAHPDDEVIATGGVLAKAAAAGRRTAVVTCTGGERGQIVGDGMDPEEIRPRLREVRAAELAEALGILGVTDHTFLGYTDSGMMGADGNDDPSSFWRADTDEAVGRLVGVIRRFRPTVLVTYDAYGGYGHPDHIQTHRVGLLAAEAAGSAALYPKAGPAWRPAKVYFVTYPKSAIAAANALLAQRGLPSPFGDATDPADIPEGTPDEQITTTVDVRAHLDAKQRALHAHRSQVGSDSLFLNVPDDLVPVVFGQEWFVRHRTDVPAPDTEDDLFAGVA